MCRCLACGRYCVCRRSSSLFLLVVFVFVCLPCFRLWLVSLLLVVCCSSRLCAVCGLVSVCCYCGRSLSCAVRCCAFACVCCLLTLPFDVVCCSVLSYVGVVCSMSFVDH